MSAGTLLAKTPREVAGTQDITGGLPRVTEIFEARTPRDPAKMAEVAGTVRLGEKKRGKRTDLHPAGRRRRQARSARSASTRCRPASTCASTPATASRKATALVFGPLVPHEILKISGIEAVQQYLVQEVQTVYRSQRVEIDDKHIEIIVSQMLRKVKVETMGDTGLLPGSVIDKFAFRAVNDRPEGVREDQGRRRLEVRGGQDRQQGRLRGGAGRAWRPRTRSRRRACSRRRRRAATQLLGITKAAVQSDSFISAASFQETTKVLTEAALAGKVDYLVGLKENVILGHLVPAGTGFHTHQEAEVRLNAPALAAATADGDGEEEPTPAETAVTTE